MDIEELLRMDEAHRHAATARNLALLRRQNYRQDAATYLAETLAELQHIARKAGLWDVSASIGKARSEARALLDAGRRTPAAQKDEDEAGAVIAG